MNPETWKILITNVGMLGAWAIGLFALYKSLTEYWEKKNDRAVAIAKEQSVGAKALRIIAEDIKAVEDELDALKKFRGKAENDYSLINALVLKLREDYKFIMDRIFTTKI